MTVGELLRRWREQRGVSQFRLAERSGVSTRHLSFVENGRSAPSREMVLHLAEQLDLPMRERNDLLLAAGFAPVCRETPLHATEMGPVRAALRQLLTSHEPYPALVLDRSWTLVEANDSLELFTGLASPELMEPPVNVLRLALHPRGMAPHIVNLAEAGPWMLSRLRRRMELTGDPALIDLHDEMAKYLHDMVGTVSPPPVGADIVVPLRLRRDGRELSFFCTVATFGMPADVTVAELAIESFLPADEATAAHLIRRHTR